MPTSVTEQQVQNGQVQVVPGSPDTGSTNQIGITDLSGQLAVDPGVLLNDDMKLSNQVPTISNTQVQNASQQNITPDTPTPQAQTTTAQTTTAGPATGNTQAANVQTATTANQVADPANQVQAAQGTVSNQAKVNTDGVEIDTEKVANGETATGKALNQAATQNMSNIIDTSTMAGKILAEQLGEGNYTDSKATLKGQLDILQKEFTGPSGEPTIPAWAAGTARQVSRIAAFKGMTGTAATAAMAQALMEASLPVAQQDAQFFQTLTLKNLDNRQQSTINKANVLAKMDLANMDARMTAAVENASNFMKMDLANLDNEQQARVINTQARVQSILEDAKAENTNRLFVAQSQNEKDMFYSNLNASIDQFNSSQKNAMSQFNASEANDVSKFNTELENNREQFYKNMQFQIDTANAKWRQTVTLNENQQKFEAAATDVKNRVGISTEQLNRLWDRSDALLDYVWKTADNEADRKNQIALMKLQGNINADISQQQGTGSLLGTLLGIAGSAVLGMFGF
jgi:hypothetical protein